MLRKVILCLLKPLRGLGLKEKIVAQYVLLHEMFFESKLGIHTRGFKRDINHPDSHFYEPVSYSVIFSVLKILGIRSLSFADVGCGKGRVLCSALALHPRKVIGIEIDAELANLARKNIEQSLSHQSTQIQATVEQCSATDFDYQGVDCFFLYNPFGQETLRSFLQALTRSHEKDPARKIKIAYLNPVHYQVFNAFSWLKLESEFPETHFLGFHVWPREGDAPKRGLQIWASV